MLKNLKYKIIIILSISFVLPNTAGALTMKEILQRYDDVKPQILGVTTIGVPQVLNITSVSADIVWQTDVESTSQVILVEENYSPIKNIPFIPDQNLVTNHKVSLTNLLPGFKYTLYVASQDAQGNVVKSGNFDTLAGFTSFTTVAVDSTAQINYRVDTKGPKNVFAGSDLYFSARGVLLAGQKASLYFKEVTGLPPSISYHVLCSYNETPSNELLDSAGITADGMPWCYERNDSGFSVRLRTSSNTPTGNYTVNFLVESLGLSKTFSYAFTVLPAPTQISKIQPSVIPPIPGLKKWEDTMLILGNKWCDLTKQFAFGYEGDVWFYDGARVYLQMADYTKDSKWIECSNYILSQYRDKYVIPGEGGSPSYRKFPHGMAMDYFKFNTPASKLGVTYLYNSVNTPYINGVAPIWGFGGDPSLTRELSYAIDTFVMGERVGLPRSPYLPIAVNMAIGYVDSLFISEPNQINQTAFDGLLAESLIQYYELTQDIRIPPVIKIMLDKIWENSWDKSAKKLEYNPMYVPPFYENTLINLTAPAFAWYWNLTGDDIYMQRGDELFFHALDQDISFSGKIFSQNYRWSFDYVRWRSGIALSTTNPGSNTTGAPTPTPVVTPTPTPTPTPTSIPTPTPLVTPTPSIAPTPTPTPVTTTQQPQQQNTPTTTNSVPLKLINQNGTYYVVKEGKRLGITNPGMLFSYGLEFKDAKLATAGETNLPVGPILLPGDGALVKSPNNPTVYLISRGLKHGFNSEATFRTLGFSFTKVLTVTTPELDKMAVGSVISDPKLAHLPGTDINIQGTIYYIGSDNKRYGYPSQEVWNSWHFDNDFSNVVIANTADLSLPVGDVVPLRKIE